MKKGATDSERWARSEELMPMAYFMFQLPTSVESLWAILVFSVLRLAEWQMMKHT